jgi:hypothetical protein
MSNGEQTPCIELAGASGRKYTLHIFGGDVQFKPGGGVYVITRAAPGQNGGLTHQILYVGQTGDLSERFDQHHKAESCRRHGANRICAMLAGDEQTRLAIERDLVAQYNPPCNG